MGNITEYIIGLHWDLLTSCDTKLTCFRTEIVLKESEVMALARLWWQVCMTVVQSLKSKIWVIFYHFMEISTVWVLSLSVWVFTVILCVWLVVFLFLHKEGSSPPLACKDGLSSNPAGTPTHDIWRNTTTYCINVLSSDHTKSQTNQNKRSFWILLCNE